ncbi:MAG: ABA4-like family protein [Spirosomataceae bacterium]
MNLETVFSIANALVFPQWMLMIFAPNWQWTQRLVNAYIIPIILAVIYAFYVLSGISNLDFQAFSTLAGVMKLFTDQQGVLAGWVHYLCFDLMVGSWVFNNAKERGVKHILVVPCLFFCFMLGPIGLLLYLLIRKFA